MIVKMRLFKYLKQAFQFQDDLISSIYLTYETIIQNKLMPLMIGEIICKLTIF